MGSEEKMSVLFMTPRMGIGGAQRYVIAKATWLHEFGHKVVVCSEEGEWVYKLTEQGISHYALPWITEDPYLIDYEELTNRLKKINQIVNEEEIDFIEANQLHPAVYAYHLGKITNIPVIFNVLSELSFLNTRNKQFLIEMNKQNLYFNLGKESNRILEKKNNIDLSNCINLPIPIENPTLNIRRGDYLLTVARFAREKRYIQFLMKDYVEFIIENNVHGYDFKIVGNGPLFKRYRRLSNKLNNSIKKFDSKIELLGYRVDDELEKLYENCDIYVGMGTTLLSAAAHSKPAIIATFPPFDISEGYGYFGEIEGNTSFGQISEEMQKRPYKNLIKDVFFDSDNYKMVAKRSYSITKEEYDIDNIMKKWISIYKDVKNKSVIYSENKIINESLRVYALRCFGEVWKAIKLVIKGKNGRKK